ncbi:MAG: CMP/dCMP kinase [Actinomycetota bacterium]|jgi:cytidylate kinase|nr:CMP/dCMP kinase [Actinomycetota bacterium]
MYRALTLAALEDGLDIADIDALNGFVASMDVSLDDNSVTVGDRDVTSRLRSSKVTEAVARIAADPAVRAALVPLQQRLARQRDIVVEGRDIGTVVFPDADVKVYLTASPAQRALRRTLQLGLPQDDATVEALEAEIHSRDQTDATRDISPLQQAVGAHRIDSSEMSLDDVVAAVVALVHAARGESP